MPNICQIFELYLNNICLTFYHLTLPPTASQYLVVPRGGASEAPPQEISEGSVFDPMLLKAFQLSIELWLTCKKLERNLKNWPRNQIFKKKSRQSQKSSVIAKMSAIRPNVNILSSSFLQTSLFS